MIQTEEIDRPWKEIQNMSSKKCFGCGPANEIGMKLQFQSNGTLVRTEFQVPEALAGWANLTHGGVTATLIDETLAWTAIYLRRKFILTKNIRVDYLKPIFVGDRVKAVGKIVEEVPDRELKIACEVHNLDGELVAFGEGQIVLLDRNRMEKMGYVDPIFLNEFESIVLNQPN